MPARKKYANAAERQAAHRARQQGYALEIWSGGAWARIGLPMSRDQANRLERDLFGTTGHQFRVLDIAATLTDPSLPWL